MEPCACLKIAYESISMAYSDLLTLNSDTSCEKLTLRRLIIPGHDLMKITHGCYVIFYYCGGLVRLYPDRTHYSKDIKTLRFQFTQHTFHNGIHDGHYMVAKFTDDGDFTQQIDITLDDLILFNPKKLLAIELAEQLAIHKAIL